MKQFLLVIFLFSFLTLSASTEIVPVVNDDLSIVDLNPIKEFYSIKIYPNPAEDHIQITNSENIRRVVVHNLVGRRVKEFNNINSGDRMNISDLPSGLYLVRLWDHNKRVVTTLRLSKR